MVNNRGSLVRDGWAALVLKVERIAVSIEIESVRADSVQRQRDGERLSLAQLADERIGVIEDKTTRSRAIHLKWPHFPTLTPLPEIYHDILLAWAKVVDAVLAEDAAKHTIYATMGHDIDGQRGGLVIVATNVFVSTCDKCAFLLIVPTAEHGCGGKAHYYI